MPTLRWAIVAYYLLINLLLLILFYADKQFSIRKKWRIPERVLLICGLLGGAPGGLIGMRLCCHKTQKFYFRLLYWLAVLLHLAILWLVQRQWDIF